MQPLAELLRPKVLGDVIGQSHLVASRPVELSARLGGKT